MEQRAAVACMGAGRMGRGIAHAFAYAGHEVRLIDAKPRDAAARQRLFDEARVEIRGTLEQIAGQYPQHVRVTRSREIG